MATNRPLARLGISDLEILFEKQSGDLASIERIKNELSYRQVPRAIALQERIRLSELKPIEKVLTTDSAADLKPYEEPNQPSKVIATQLDFLGSTQTGIATKIKEPSLIAKDLVSPELQQIPQMALEDACRILKVSTGDTWEKIENARRKAVQKSNPIANIGKPLNEIEKLLSEVRLANDAAIVIAARRSGRQ